MPEVSINVNIHNTPRVIGDYAMIMSHPVTTMEELLDIMVLITDNLGMSFVFNADLFPAVLKGVQDYIEFKRLFIRDCTNLIEARGPNSVPLSLELLSVYSSVRANQHQLTQRRELPPRPPAG